MVAPKPEAPRISASELDIAMAPNSAVSVWLTDGLPTAKDRKYNKKRAELFDAAENSKWDKLFALLQDAQKTYNESWVNCPTSGDGWTPLHYAVSVPSPRQQAID